jgi:hypothetical protein
MPYLKRNTEGTIVAISDEVMDGFTEITEAEAEEAARFAADTVGTAEESISQTDLDFVRVLEDLIELMMDKNIIQFTELPPASQTKMLARQKLRKTMKSHLELLDEEKLFL